MADNVVSVEFGAKTDGIDRGSADVQEKLKQLQAQTDAMSQSMNSFGDAVKVATDEAALNLGKVDELVKKLNEEIQKGGNVSALSGIIGVLGSKGGVIGLAIAGLVEGVHLLGEEFVTLERNATRVGESITGFERLQSIFNAAGISTKEVADGLKKTSDALLNLNYDSGELGKFLDANNIKWKDANDHVISLDEYLKQAATLLQKAAAEGGGPLAAKVGESLKISEDMVRVLEKGPVALAAAQQKAQDLGAVLDAETVHKAAQFTQEWDAATSRFATQFKAMLAGLIPAIQEWAGKIGEALSAVFASLWASLKLSFEETTAKMAGDVASFSDRFGAAEGSLKSLAGSLNDVKKNLDGSKVSTENILGGFEEIASTGKEIEKIKFPTDKDKGFDPTPLIELRVELDKINDSYKRTKITEDNAVATFKETEGQKVANLRAALDQREKAIEEVFAKEYDLTQDNARRRAQVERDFNKQMQEIGDERLKLEAEQLKRSAQEWQSVLGTISGAFTSQLRGLLQGTTSWSTAIKNIMTDLVVKIIEEFLKLAVIKPLSGMLASALSAPTELFAQLFKIIGSMFGPLMAGFTAFFAPVQGPAAPAEGAALAAATTAAAVAAVGSAEMGTDSVPRTGYAYVHQGEAIIPAAMNPFTGGASLASPTINFSVQAWDAQSVQNWLKAGGGGLAIAKIVAAMMNQNPTLRPSY